MPAKTIPPLPDWVARGAEVAVYQRRNVWPATVQRITDTQIIVSTGESVAWSRFRRDTLTLVGRNRYDSPQLAALDDPAVTAIIERQTVQDATLPLTAVLGELAIGAQLYSVEDRQAAIGMVTRVRDAAQAALDVLAARP